MTISEILDRVRFVKHLYETVIIKQVEERHLLEAKKDLKALSITLALLEERSNKSEGSEEIYTK